MNAPDPRRAEPNAASDAVNLPDLSELKAEVERMTAAVASIVEQRSRQAGQLAQQGASEGRKLVRAYPWTAIGVAGVAGAALALAVIPKRQDTWPARDLRRYARSGAARIGSAMPTYMPSFGMPAIAMPSIDSRSITSRIEKVADAISDIDPKAISGPIADAAQRWLNAFGVTKT